MATNEAFDPALLTGLKRIRDLLPMLASLREVGCRRDKAGQRELHFDEYVTLMLLYLSNPLLKSLRGLQAVSELDRVAIQLGIKRFSLGSFSESVRLFDPDKLKAVVDKLAGKLKPFNKDPRLANHLDEILTVCDGTELMGISKVAGAWMGRLLTDADLTAGVVRDSIVTMGATSVKNARPDHKMRLIVVEIKPHLKRGNHRGPGNKGTMVIVTSLLDLPAEIILLIYQHRWAIEIFFRFFKQTLGCRHLISERPQGVMIQVYCAMIHCMLINLWTGKKPTLRTVELMAFYHMGLATEADVIAHLNKPDMRGTKLRAQAELLKKLGW